MKIPLTSIKTTYKRGVIAGLACLLASTTLHAQGIIDHVETTKTNATELTRIFFNTPVQYLYHTPKNKTSNSLIGLYFNNKNTRTVNTNLSFRKSGFITDMEFFSEPGFNPHIHIHFNTEVDLTVKPGQYLRSIILEIKKHK